MKALIPSSHKNFLKHSITWLCLFLVILGLLSSACTGGSTQTPGLPAGQTVKAIKLLTGESGLYVFTSADAARLGWNNIDPANLVITNQSQPVKSWVEKQADAWQVRFFAEAINSPYSSQNSYIVQQKTSLQSGTITFPAPARPQLPVEMSAGAGFSPFILRLEENKQYVPEAAKGDHWFFGTIPAIEPMQVKLPIQALTSGTSYLRMQVWSATSAPVNPDHRLRISVGGQMVREESWKDSGWHTIEVKLNEGVLKTGENVLKVELVPLPEVTAQATLLDWVEVIYPRQLRAEQDRLWFFGSGSPQQLTGFSGAVTIFDVTDPQKIDQAGTSVEFTGQAGHYYLAVGPKGSLSAQTVQNAVTEPDLRSAQPVDYLVLGSPELLQAAKPLLDWRQQSGLKVSGVPLQAVYDQFGGGLPDPQAIKAYVKWVKPRFLLLIGDATTDPKGYVNPVIANQLPVNYVDTSFSGETGSDLPYVEIMQEGKPEIAVGRIPAQTPAQVTAVVDKVLAYEQQQQKGDWRSGILAVADGQDGSFKQNAQAFLDLFGNTYQTNLIAPAAGAVNISQEINTRMNQGQLLVAYFGHGSLLMWGKDKLYSTTEIAGLTNRDRLPIMINMTCLTGYFMHPKRDSLMEGFLLKPKDGAVAVLAPTSLTLADDQSMLSGPFAREIQSAETKTIGEALLKAWQQMPAGSASTREVQLTFLLFGDPALRLR